MEASSSRATDGLSQEQLLELEDVWSELYALKKLYGLLQKTSAEVPNANGNGNGNLDDKARLLLKKLLDGATHHALQYQAKIVCSPPTAELHRPSRESLEKETKSTEELQKCQPGAQIQPDQAEEPTSPPNASTAGPEQNEPKSLAVAEPKIIPKPCPIRETGDLKRQISSKTTSSGISDRNSSRRRHHRPMHQDRVRSSRIRSSKEKPSLDYLAVVPAKSAFSVPEDQQTGIDGPDKDKQDKTRRMMSRHGRTSNRDLLAMVPAHKNARVEATDRLGRATSETRIDGRAKKDTNQTVEIGRIDQGKAGIIAHSKQESVTPGRDGSISRRRRPPSHPKSPSPGPSQPRHQKLTRLPSSRNRPGASLHRTKLPPRIASRNESTRCSSLSCTSESGCSTSSTESDTEVAGAEVGWSRKKAGPIFARDEKAPPPRRTRSYRQLAPSRVDAPRRRSPPNIPRHQHVGPKKRSVGTARADEEKKPSGGRLRRFKDRLAIIFHHHHHHHLHPTGHVDGDDDLSRPHHRAPWKYIRSIVRRRRPRGDQERLKRAPAQQQHGHVYALLEALVRHVWGLTRRRKAVPRRPGKTGGKKKVHWWQRFRRRGGVKLAGRRTKPRLKLLGYTRSHSRTNRKG